MADIDLPGQFPNSKMAGAVKQGQSQFISIDVAGTLRTKTEAEPKLVAPKQPDVIPLKR